MGFYNFVRWLLNVLTRIYHKVEYRGTENVPDRSFLACSNHVSFIDPALVAIGVKRHFRFMAKAELFRIPVLSFIIKKLGAFPVSRGSGDMTPINTSIDIINGGGNLLIFPEGTRSRTGELLRPRSGSALVAMKTGADILPVAIRYEKKGRFRSKLTVSFGEMIPNAELGLDPDNPRTFHSASKYIMEKIRVLWEKE